MKEPGPPPADLVLQNGAVYTMNPTRPEADAVAVRDGRFVAVGAAADVAPLVGPQTRVIDLRGRAVTPGLIDAHCHLHNLGYALENLSLKGAPSPEAVAAAVKEAAAGRAPGEWILGRGWDQNLWPHKEFPTRAVLDAAAPDRPVALSRVDGHALWVNGAALKAAGITRATPDPAGGRILRDDKGEPTGVLIDAAMVLVSDKMPDAGPEVIERRILAAQAAALQAGLVGVHDMGVSDAALAVYQKLQAEGRLTLRVYAVLAGSAVDNVEDRQRILDPDGSGKLVVRAIKLFADGALGSRGAALLEPYSDDPDNRGLLQLSAEELEARVERAVDAGWQLAIHAIGDRGNRMVLDAYEKVLAKRPDADLRLRVEHAQVVHPDDIPRFAELGVVASMQPTHATSDMPWAGDRVGEARLRGAYAWQSLRRSGARLAFGSDFPVEEVSPLLGIYAAVTRQDPQGHPEGGWLPDQRLSLHDAIRGFTSGAAYASFAESQRGMIVPGYVADLTVFDGDLAPDRTLLERRVDYTIVGGAIVYARE